MNFDLARAGGRKFPLRRVHEQRRDAQAKLTMQRVSSTAGQHTRPRVYTPVASGFDRDSVAATHNGRDARAGQQPDAGANGVGGQPLIERRTVYDHGLDGASPVDDFVTCWGNETSGGQLVEDGICGETELGECFTGKHAGAVDRVADDVMFLEHGNREPVLRQTTRCM
jgi:hypothetical protein